VGVTAAASRQAVRECLANSYRLLLRRARLKFDMGGHINYEEYLKMVSHIYVSSYCYYYSDLEIGLIYSNYEEYL
jgi:hypothetical protein